MSSTIDSCADILKPTPIRYSIQSKTQSEPEKKKIFVNARFEVSSDADPGEKKLLSIQAVFVVSYDIDSLDGLEPENLDAFGRMNGVYNLWPYWREYVQSTTSRLGFPPLTLPVLTGDSLQKMYQEKAEEEKAIAESNATQEHEGEDVKK